MDWPYNFGGGSPDGGALLGNARVFPGRYVDAADPQWTSLEELPEKWYKYENANGAEVHRLETPKRVNIVYSEIVDGAGKKIEEVSGVPTPGENWQNLPDGPGMGYFLCMAWCRITPWCKAMSAGTGSTRTHFTLNETATAADTVNDAGSQDSHWSRWDADQVHGCWLRGEEGRANTTYLPEWERTGAEVHSAFRVCPQRDQQDVTTVIVITDTRCRCDNGKRKDTPSDTCHENNQQDCERCHADYELVDSTNADIKLTGTVP